MTQTRTFEAALSVSETGRSFSNYVLNDRRSLDAVRKVAPAREPRHDPGMEGVLETQQVGGQNDRSSSGVGSGFERRVNRRSVRSVEPRCALRRDRSMADG